MARSRDSVIDPWTPPRPPTRGCDHAGCSVEGAFRAPRSRSNLGPDGNYYWFCLDHVREYNATWNYYAGMSDAEIEHEIRHNTVWERPTWPLGWRVSSGRWRDPLHILRENGVGEEPTREERARAERRARPLSEEEKALAVFELDLPFAFSELRARYKLLVKLHHPDANGGSREAEERLKIVTLAYAFLKSRHHSQG